jgi:tetratricopeptide (TPR) repeat protein
VKMYEGLTLNKDDRKNFIYAAAASEDMTGAANQARLMVLDDPKDKTSQRLLADVLSWKGDFHESLTLYERLLRDDKTDKQLNVDIAKNLLWKSDYPEAMRKYGGILNEQFEQQELWKGFIDAVSSAANTQTLNDEQKKMAIAIYERWMAFGFEDPARLSRLGWVMYKVGDTVRANAAANRALTLVSPGSLPSIRRELAGVLAVLDRRPEALAMVRDLPNMNFADRNTLATLYSANRQFDSAEKELRDLLAAKPRDPELTKELGRVLLWNGKYREAEAVFASLLMNDANNLEIQLNLAQSALWSRRTGPTRNMWPAMWMPWVRWKRSRRNRKRPFAGWMPILTPCKRGSLPCRFAC